MRIPAPKRSHSNGEGQRARAHGPLSMCRVLTARRSQQAAPKLWDVGSFKEKASLQGHTDTVNSLKFWDVARRFPRFRTGRRGIRLHPVMLWRFLTSARTLKPMRTGDHGLRRPLISGAAESQRITLPSP